MPTSSSTSARPGATARLFIGLWPGPEARDAVLRWQAACAWPAGARPTPAERLHVTLHFLGQVERAGIDALARAIDLSPPAPPFELMLDRAAVWPNDVAVLEPSGAPPPELPALHARLAEALRGCGIAPEARPFRPHATLARRARGAALPAAGSLPPVRWRVAGYALVESDRGYRTLRRFG